MAYTYLIGWSDLDKWYYGVRFAKSCNPVELWKSYFTSSKHVQEFRKQYGEPDVIKVTKEFNNVDDARLWESKVLKRLNVVESDRFLNKTDNVSIDPESARVGGLKSTNLGAVRKDLSERNKQAVGEKNHMFGKRGELAPHYGRTGEKHPMFGKTNKGASAANKKELTCPHCLKTGQASGMNRWHFNNCSSNISSATLAQ